MGKKRKDNKTKKKRGKKKDKVEKFTNKHYVDFDTVWTEEPTDAEREEHAQKELDATQMKYLH